ncbi:MAG: hypothetical protein U9N49_04750 [Campylobacterota bacterium]|nr:hypothetical protein [Campylobacterota bacterium]
MAQAKNKIFATIGFLKMGDNYRLIDTLLAQTLLSKASVEAVSAWR